MISPLWPLNVLLDLWIGGRKRPVVFDVDAVAPALRTLDSAYAEIRREVESLLAERVVLPRYHEVDPFQGRISRGYDAGRDWRVFMLYAMGERPAANCARAPKTAALCDAIPNLFQAFFSILDPGKSIPRHCGPYRGYLRYHLGLIVPKENPPYIRVRDHRHEWREGESILFDDSWDHEVVNHSNGVRVILIVDVLRPLPLVPHALNLAMQAVIRRVYARGILRMGA